MKQLVLICLKVSCAIIICGLTYQWINSQIDHAQYSSDKKLVDIGGYKLHFNKTGPNSAVTVVLDIGMGGNLLYWHLVQPEIAKFARVVSYDRAGFGWSDPSPKPRTSENIAEELHTLLHNANIPAPYLLVGHSFAGINARIFANKYPDEVMGVILVDSSHENQLQTLPKQTDLFSNLLRHKAGHPILIGLANVGFARIYESITYDHKLPDDVRSELIATNSTAQFMKSCIGEWSMFSRNLDYTTHTKPNLHNKPLIVITAGIKPHEKLCADHGFDNISCENAYTAWQILQKDLAKKSSRSKQIIADHSGHNIPIDAPDVIIKAVKDMLENKISWDAVIPDLIQHSSV
jgi:pimeloyl-ACP methyl ester carboxylesterase